MRKTILILTILLPAISTYGQTAPTSAEQKQMIAKIDKAAAAIRTMQCSFTQVKSMTLMKNSIKAEGTMYFKKPNRLKLAYTTPYDYTFIMADGKAYMKAAGKTTTIDVNKNKMFRQITEVIMNCMIGGKLSKTSYFKIAMYKSGGIVQFTLTPLKKELKQIYSQVTLTLNSSQTMVTKVEMKEKNGDKTTITLSDIKLNGNVSDKLFSNN